MILCPLRKELNLLKEHLKFDFSNHQAAHLPYWKSQGLSLAVAGHGKSQAAVQSSYWLQTLNPEIVICCGAGGALTDKVGVGGIVVGTSTIEHDFKEGFNAKAKFPEFHGDKELIDRLRAHKNLHFGSIASGDEDIISPERSRQLNKATGALCAAWEGAGIARAARFYQKRFLEIRAITDNADGEAADHFRDNLARAMGELAKVLSLLL